MNYLSNINFDLSSPFGKVVVLIVAILVLSFLINFLLSRSVFGGSYRIFVAPGVIIHELSHALLCLVTGAKITKIDFFDKNGGSVEHKPSKIPVVGQVLISLAPFVFGAVLIFLLSKRLGVGDISFSNVSEIANLRFYKEALKNLDFYNWQTYIIIYLVVSIAVTMTPSWQDLRNITLSGIFLVLLYIALVRFGHISFSFSNISIPMEIFTLLSGVTVLLILSLVLSMMIYAISKLLKPI